MTSVSSTSHVYLADESLSAAEAAVLISSLKNFPLSELAQRNIDQTQLFLTHCPAVASFTLQAYKRDLEIVQLGQLVQNHLGHQPLGYAPVPLGIITKGEVIVLKEGKGIKRLLPGDFIGLFETAHLLHTGGTRRIGDWTLVTDTEVQILFFNDIDKLRQDPSRSFLEFGNYLIDMSRGDLVPKPITDLRLLDYVAGQITESLLECTIVLTHTHILPTSLALFRHLAHLVGYQNLFVLDKPYSTVRSVARDLIRMGADVVPVLMIDNAPYEFAVRRSVDILWDKVSSILKRRNIQKIVIIDDGADLLLSIPWDQLGSVQVVGVEQTQRGINRLNGAARRLPPIVNVAGSQVKKQIESIFIGKATVDKMRSLRLLDTAPRVGIIGSGSVGTAIRNELAATAAMDVISYDVQHHSSADKGAQTVTSLDSVLNQSDLIVGCTGDDALRGIAFERVNGIKTLVSASSADVEFFCLLNQISFGKSDFDTIEFNVHPKLHVRILNGGYPINFDREKEWEPSEDIQITRCLLYAGMIQSLTEDQGDGPTGLNPQWQEMITKKWQELKRH